MEIKNTKLIEFVKLYGEEKVWWGMELYLRSRTRSEDLRLRRKNEVGDLKSERERLLKELEILKAGKAGAVVK